MTLFWSLTTGCISLLSNVNKLFGRIVHKSLYSFLNKCNCIYELQFGFRAEHSTNHALLSLTEKIREALGSKGENLHVESSLTYRKHLIL